MPDRNVRTDIVQVVQNLGRRVENLERALRTGPRRAPEWSLVEARDSFVSGIRTTKHYPRWTSRLHTVVLSLVVAGTTATVVTILKNGSSVGTITLGATGTSTKGPFDVMFGHDQDYVQVELTTIGSGSSGIEIQMRFN